MTVKPFWQFRDLAERRRRDGAGAKRSAGADGEVEGRAGRAVELHRRDVMPPPKLKLVLPLAKFVVVPVTVTLALSAWRKLAGLMPVIAAGPRATPKNEPPANDEAICAPVVSVTVRLPMSARAPIVTLTVAVVALLTVTLLTVMPGPKLAVVVPFTKVVN